MSTAGQKRFLHAINNLYMDLFAGTQRRNTQLMVRFTSFFKKLRKWVANLFRPEEVEVTFKVEGKNVTYTYTKVVQKQVA